MGCGASKPAATAESPTERHVAERQGEPGTGAPAGEDAKPSKPTVAQRAIEIGSAAQERFDELQKLLNLAEPLSGSIASMLQQYSVTGDVLRVLAKGGLQALEVLARAPLVGPLAEVASRVMTGIAEAVAVRAALEDFKRVVVGVVEVVVEANEVVRQQTRALEELTALLQEARQVVEEVEGRTWLGRFVKARGDTDGLQELAGKVLAQVGTLMAAMQVQSLRGIEEIRSAISGGKLFSSQDLAGRLAKEAGATRLEDVSPAQLRAVLGDKQRVDAVFGMLAPGEQVLAGLVQNVGDKVEQLGAQMDRMMEVLMTQLKIGQVVDSEPQEVKKLPRELREMWVSEDDGFGQVAGEMQWATFEVAMLNDELYVIESAAKWYKESLDPPEWAMFVQTHLRQRLAPTDVVRAQGLYEVAQGAKRRKKMEFAEVRLRDVLWYVHANAVGTAGAGGGAGVGAGAARQAGMRRLATVAREGMKGVEVQEVKGMAMQGTAGVMQAQGVKGVGTQGVDQGVLQRLGGVLQHWDFLQDADAREATSMAGTRVWLEGQVMEWVEGAQTGKRANVFLLLSLPGMGKTAFVAHVAVSLHKAGRLLGGHFCRAGDEARTDARAVVQSLAFQIAEAVPGAAEAVAEGLKGIDINGAATEWFQKLVAEPLRGVAWDDKPMALVIDAVDEAGTDTRSNGVLQLLAGALQELPAWVKVLVTSRPEAYVVKQMARFDPFTLEPTEERNRDDIRAYIRGCLRTEGLSDKERGAVVEALLGKSEGVFAYVSALVGMVQREAGAGVSEGLAQVPIAALPAGHRALYKDYFDRQFRSLRMREVDVVRGSILPAIVAAMEPLRVAELQEVAGHGGVGEEVAGRALAAMGSLFPIRADGRVRPFHKSVVDWLVEDTKSGWHVDLRQGHMVHADVWGRKAAGVGPGGVSGACLAALGQYPAQYALHHALEAGAVDTIVALCTSLGYLRAAAEAGAVGSLVAGVAVATGAVGGHLHAGRVRETRAWLRVFGSMLAERPDMAVDVAGVAPKGTWMRTAAEQAKAAMAETDSWEITAVSGTRVPERRVKLAGCMARLPSVQALPGELSVSALLFSAPQDDAAPSRARRGAYLTTVMTLRHIDNGTVRLWDATTGQALRTLTPPDDEDTRMRFRHQATAFAPNGDHLLVMCAAHDGPALVRVWECATGALIFTDEVPGGYQDACVDVNHASVAGGHAFRKWELATGAVVADVYAPWWGHAEGDPTCIALSDDGACAAVGHSSGAVAVLDLPGCTLRAVAMRCPGTVAALQVRRGGAWVAAACGDAVYVWDDGVERVLGGHDGKVFAMAASGDGAGLVATAEGGHVVWNTAKGQEAGRVPKDTCVRKPLAPFSSDGRWAAVPHFTDVVLVDVHSQGRLVTVPVAGDRASGESHQWVSAVAFHPSNQGGYVLACADQRREVQILDLGDTLSDSPEKQTQPKELSPTNESPSTEPGAGGPGNEGPVGGSEPRWRLQGGVVSADGREALGWFCASDRSELRLYDVARGELRLVCDCSGTARPQALAVGDGRAFAVFCEGAEGGAVSVRVLDVLTGASVNATGDAGAGGGGDTSSTGVGDDGAGGTKRKARDFAAVACAALGMVLVQDLDGPDTGVYRWRFESGERPEQWSDGTLLGRVGDGALVAMQRGGRDKEGPKEGSEEKDGNAVSRVVEVVEVATGEVRGSIPASVALPHGYSPDGALAIFTVSESDDHVWVRGIGSPQAMGQGDGAGAVTDKTAIYVPAWFGSDFHFNAAGTHLAQIEGKMARGSTGHVTQLTLWDLSGARAAESAGTSTAGARQGKLTAREAVALTIPHAPMHVAFPGLGPESAADAAGAGLAMLFTSPSHFGAPVAVWVSDRALREVVAGSLELSAYTDAAVAATLGGGHVSVIAE